MRQLFNHWLVLCLLLGVAACGGTVTSTSVSVGGKSADSVARSKRQPDVPDKSLSIENQTAIGDERAMLRSPLTPPKPKPQTYRSLVIKNDDVMRWSRFGDRDTVPEGSTTTLMLPRRRKNHSLTRT